MKNETPCRPIPDTIHLGLLSYRGHWIAKINWDRYEVTPMGYVEDFHEITQEDLDERGERLLEHTGYTSVDQIVFAIDNAMGPRLGGSSVLGSYDDWSITIFAPPKPGDRPERVRPVGEIDIQTRNTGLPNAGSRFKPFIPVDGIFPLEYPSSAGLDLVCWSATNLLFDPHRPKKGD